MLQELLVTFIFGLIVGRALSKKGVRPNIHGPSFALAAALLFVMGLNVGTAKGALVDALPSVGFTAFFIGVTAALSGVFLALLFRRRVRA
jgi:hypothetical protein